MKVETQRQSTYLTFSNTPMGKPMHIVAASRLCSEICFSHPYSTTEPNVPLLKKLAMERCSDQTMKGKNKIYYRTPEVYEFQVIV